MTDLNGTLPNTAAALEQDNKGTLEYWQKRLIGKTYIGEDEETALGENQVVLHSQLPEGHRILAPNTLMTKDFRPLRLNVTMNDGGKITGVHFG
ncbi:hypothetical protein BC937DRAFT_91734 [Endogone sp. FLAS-F59071]|nr:hypothetical protein BC937DRAFT_91734 [Endogone sp. FLAS-F59071]|eukprot:RUS15978.1 hypothetical protein BC937DRAFT_91734 [Endogone sp. FLAS-F59071]